MTVFNKCKKNITEYFSKMHGFMSTMMDYFETFLVPLLLKLKKWFKGQIASKIQLRSAQWMQTGVCNRYIHGDKDVKKCIWNYHIKSRVLTRITN